jgi:hypothetical protein
MNLCPKCVWRNSLEEMGDRTTVCTKRLNVALDRANSHVTDKDWEAIPDCPDLQEGEPEQREKPDLNSVALYKGVCFD